MKALALSLLSLAGCDSSGSNAADLSSLEMPSDGHSVVEDLSLSLEPDLPFARDLARNVDVGLDSSAPDASSFCANGPATGTCAQTFFAAVGACFQPLGACQNDSTKIELCWTNGASMVFVVPATGPYLVTYATSGRTCMIDSVAITPVIHTLSANGQMLIYNTSTGDVTCPDGSHANIGTNYGCTDIYTLFNPPSCRSGSCP